MKQIEFQYIIDEIIQHKLYNIVYFNKFLGVSLTSLFSEPIKAFNLNMDIFNMGADDLPYLISGIISNTVVENDIHPVSSGHMDFAKNTAIPFQTASGIILTTNK